MTSPQDEAPSKLRDTLRSMNFKLADSSPEYIQRRKKQMVLFMTAAAATIFTSRFAYKSTITRQYVPTLFQGNHLPPLSYNFTQDATVAVGTGTMLCASVSSMLIFGTCWIMDVSSFEEFGWRMKSALGGVRRQMELAKTPVDEESATIQDGLNDILEGKFEPNFDDEARKQWGWWLNHLFHRYWYCLWYFLWCCLWVLGLVSLQNLVKLRQFHSVYKMTYTKCVNMLTVVVQSTVVQILNSNVISD